MALVGYARVSSVGQSLEVQLEKLKHCDKLYEGRTFQGKVRRTIVMGRTVFQDGEITGQPGWGQIVRPDPARIHEEL